MIRFYILILIVLLSNNGFGQNPVKYINDQLRNIIEDLDRPHNPPRWFHYDMAAHMVDEKYFTNYSTDTSNTANWFMLFEEMRNSAYDTTILPLADAIYNQVLQYSGDTIPIGIMDFDFYRFKENALESGDYFSFDTINQKLYDIDSRSDHPFETFNLFAASPLYHQSKFRNPTFAIDVHFLFIDDFNTSYYHNSSIEIDFGDGQGFIVFNPNVTTYHTVNYPTEGNYIITVNLVNDVVIKSSKSTIYIQSNTHRIPPSEVWTDIDGLRVGVYKGCNNDELKKPLIYLEGIDIGDFYPKWNRDIESLYEEVQKFRLAELQNHDYDIIVVDWENSRRDMTFNAMAVVELIEKLKNLIADEHQFVLIGESMGGIVGRYALTYMETDDYLANGSVEVEQMHNTRLYISYDSPHQGANIPMSVQTAYKHVHKIINPGLIDVHSKVLLQLFNLFLDSKAAQQLLIYHIDTKNDFCNTSIYSCYTKHNARNDFMENLIGLNNNRGYPEFCKNVAVTNGSIYGGKQTNFYDGTDRTPNDYLLDFGSEIYIRVLGIKVKIYGIDLELKTNPNGQGHIYTAQAGTWFFDVKLYWFGVKVEVNTNSMISRTEYADLEPYCINPGGYFDTDLQPIQKNYNSVFDIFIFKSIVSNNNNGHFEFSLSVGIPWLANGNLNVSMFSEGFHFAFIPVLSAIDYTASVPLDHDIEAENINTTLTRTPFDLIFGIYDGRLGNLGKNKNNRYHLHSQNDELDVLRSCVGAISPNHPVSNYLINQEIGTDHLYIDNLDLNRSAIFESEYDITINGYNPYYEYPGQSSTPNMRPGAYSREDPLNIVSNGYSIFKHNANNSSGLGFTYNSPVADVSDWEETDEALEICCIDMRSFSYNKKQPSKKLFKNSVVVYPNPVSSDATLIIKSDHLIKRISIFNIVGLKVANYFNNDTNSMYININKLVSGVYIISVFTEDKIENIKIIVK